MDRNRWSKSEPIESLGFKSWHGRAGSESDRRCTWPNCTCIMHGRVFFFFFCRNKTWSQVPAHACIGKLFFLSEMTARKILYAAGVLLVKVPEAGEKENEEETKRGSNRREIEARPGHGQTNLWMILFSTRQQQCSTCDSGPTQFWTTKVFRDTKHWNTSSGQ